MEPPTYIQGVTPSLSVGSLLLPALNNSPVNAYFLREPACSRFTRGLGNASPLTKMGRFCKVDQMSYHDVSVGPNELNDTTMGPNNLNDTTVRSE